MHYRKLIVFCVLLLCTYHGFSQVYITRNGTIRFFSEAPLENIEAVNRQVSSALDTETGEFVFRVLMRAFSFEKALMQEHFNDNFVESHTYPNASFQGRIIGIEDIDFSVEGKHQVTAKGDLTIKDITRTITEKGFLTVSDEGIQAGSVFTIYLPDYNIRIPTRYLRNIASEIEITVTLQLQPR
jgi:hypothetical protein